MLALAAYFAAKPWPNLMQPGASDADTRRALQANTSIGCTVPPSRLSGGRSRATPRWAAACLSDENDGGFSRWRAANNPGMTDLMKVAAPKICAALAQFSFRVVIKSAEADAGGSAGR